MSVETLAREVRERRDRLRLTQEDVAEHGGPSVTTMRAIENAQGACYRPKSLRSLDDVLRWRPKTAARLLAGEIDHAEPLPVPEPDATELERWKQRALEAEAKLRAIAALASPGDQTGAHDGG